jgi:hypothetical protein
MPQSDAPGSTGQIWDTDKDNLGPLAELPLPRIHSQTDADFSRESYSAVTELMNLATVSANSGRWPSKK